MLTHRVLHADEMLVQMLKPGKGATHRTYLCAYAPYRLKGAPHSPFTNTRETQKPIAMDGLLKNGGG